MNKVVSFLLSKVGWYKNLIFFKDFKYSFLKSSSIFILKAWGLYKRNKKSTNNHLN